MELPVEKILHTILIGSTVFLALLTFLFLLFEFCPARGLKNVYGEIFYSNPRTFSEVNFKVSAISNWIIASFLFAIIYLLGITVEKIIDKTHNEDIFKIITYSKLFKSENDFKGHRENAIKLDNILKEFKNKGCQNESIILLISKQPRYAIKKLLFNTKIDDCFCSVNPALFKQFKYIQDYYAKPAYYKLKNKTYSNSNYYNELQGIQSRITLTKSLKEIFKWVSISFLLILIIKPLYMESKYDDKKKLILLTIFLITIYTILFIIIILLNIPFKYSG